MSRSTTDNAQSCAAEAVQHDWFFFDRGVSSFTRPYGNRHSVSYGDRLIGAHAGVIGCDVADVRRGAPIA